MATTVVVPRSNAIANRRVVVSPGSTAISSSSHTTAVTSNSPRAGSCRACARRRARRAARGRRAPSSTRSTSERWSSSDGSSSTRWRFCTAGRRITWRPTPTSAAFGRVCSGGTCTTRSSRAGARQASRQPVAQLVRAERARVDRAHRHVAVLDPHLALLARAVAAARRVDRHAVPARGVEDRRAARHAHVRAVGLEAQAHARRAVDGGRGHVAARCRLARAVGGDPAARPRRRGRAAGPPRARFHAHLGGAHDRARQAGGHRHRQERGVEHVPLRQPERDVGRAQAHVHAERVADQADRLQRRRDRLGVGADGHRQRVDDRRPRAGSRGRRPPTRSWSRSPAAAAASRGCRSRRWPGRSPPRRGAPPAAGSPRAARPRRSPSSPAPCPRRRRARPPAPRSPTSRCRSGRRPSPASVCSIVGQQLGLVDQRDAGVDVEHVGAGLDLRGVSSCDRREVAALELLGELLAPGRVDALADDAERLVDADRDGLGPRSAGRCPSGRHHVAPPSISSLAFLTAGRRVGRVAVGADGVGVLLRDRRAADHHDHLVADAGLLRAR